MYSERILSSTRILLYSERILKCRLYSTEIQEYILYSGVFLSYSLCILRYIRIHKEYNQVQTEYVRNRVFIRIHKEYSYNTAEYNRIQMYSVRSSGYTRNTGGIQRNTTEYKCIPFIRRNTHNSTQNTPEYNMSSCIPLA